MHDAVDEGRREGRAAGHKLGRHPPDGEHRGVVVAVEEGQSKSRLQKN